MGLALMHTYLLFNQASYICLKNTLASYLVFIKCKYLIKCFGMKNMSKFYRHQHMNNIYSKNVSASTYSGGMFHGLFLRLSIIYLQLFAVLYIVNTCYIYNLSLLYLCQILDHVVSNALNIYFLLLNL